MAAADATVRASVESEWNRRRISARTAAFTCANGPSIVKVAESTLRLTRDCRMKALDSAP
jgi:hypothetical protein